MGTVWNEMKVNNLFGSSKAQVATKLLKERFVIFADDLIYTHRYYWEETLVFNDQGPVL